MKTNGGNGGMGWEWDVVDFYDIVRRESLMQGTKVDEII